MDLDNSMFFENRLTGIIQKVINDQSVKPLNGFEEKLLKQEEKLKKINQEYQNKLVRSLIEYANYIPLKEALVFLLTYVDTENLQKAKEILDWSVKEQSTMTLEQLHTSLENFDNMPTSFLPSLYGEYSEEGRKPVQSPPTKTSSIDLERLKKFK